MFFHNFLIIYRNAKKHKGAFLINLIGLSIGLSCTLLIYFWVMDELQVDAFHENHNRLYTVMENQALADGIVTRAITPDVLARALQDEVPEIEYAISVAPANWFGKIPLTLGDEKWKAWGQFAGADYFNMFSFELLAGQPESVMVDKNSIVLSQSLATSLFGSVGEAVGKSIDWELVNITRKHLVTGVFRDLPSKTTEKFDFVIPYEAFEDLSRQIGRPMNWDNHAPTTYVCLEQGTRKEAVDDKIKNFISERTAGDNITLFLKPYADGYLYGKYENGVQTGGRIEYVRLFSIIAVFILIMACINFINLSTAKASKRVKEIGIKKALGSDRRMLVLQYLLEAVMMAFVSLLLSLVIVLMFLPSFNEITGKQITLSFNFSSILVLLATTAFTGFLAGSYPALYISGFDSATVLKGKFKRSWGEVVARSGLVIFQFVLSVILIVSVVVVYRQIQYVQTENLGYEKDNVIYFNREGKATENLDAFIYQLKQIPGVLNVSSIAQNIVGNESATGDVSWEGKNPDDNVSFTRVTGGYDLIETLGISVREGRSFSREYGAEEDKIIFNEAAIELMGLSSPIGARVTIWGKRVEIIGVVENFHFESFHEPIKPVFFLLAPAETLLIMAKIQAGKESEAVPRIQAVYKEYTGYPCDYHFLDEDFQAQYEAESRVGMLSRYFAALAVFISCLGLFGLASFTAERRTKEIGIRKALGCSNGGIVYLLSKEFNKLVIVSLAFSLPVAFFITRTWLEGFAYRIELKWWYFVGAALAAIAISWFTVGLQAFKASKLDPVDCLRLDG